MNFTKHINGRTRNFDLKLSANGYVYDDAERTASNEKYMIIGVHNDNPGCYKYLDMLLIVDINSDNYKLVRICDKIGNGRYDEVSQLQHVTYANGKFYAISSLKTVEVMPDIIMADDLPAGTVIKPALDLAKMETCFDYEVLDDMAILMSLKDEVPAMHMLKWSGFDISYDTFKLSGDITRFGNSQLLFVNSKSGSCWEITWGNSTTMTSASVWKRRDGLVECVKKMMPTHCKIRESCYFKEVA